MSQEPIEVITEHPVAADSTDHTTPWGTKHNTSVFPRFNKKAYRLLCESKNQKLNILDLGCSGGSFINECLQDNHLGVGLEGSDFSKKYKRADWAKIGDKFLFTADITKPFSIRFKKRCPLGQLRPLSFDLITAWEVLEHIKKEDLPQLCENIKHNLLPTGLAIFSVSMKEEIINGATLHHTRETKIWWVDYFRKYGLEHCPNLEKYFNSHYIRTYPTSSYLILSGDREQRPTPSTFLKLKSTLGDSYFESKLKKNLLKYRRSFNKRFRKNKKTGISASNNKAIGPT